MLQTPLPYDWPTGMRRDTVSSTDVIFISKTSLVLADDKHTHNMIQPPPCWKI
jgi:hypothetical protein